MNYKHITEAIHNEYVDFKVKVIAGPFRGDHFGYIPEVKIYKGSILENTNVKFILNPNNNHVTIENFASYFFGPRAELDKQVLNAIHTYDPRLVIQPSTLKTFEELIDEL
jgi:hypothetical protein